MCAGAGRRVGETCEQTWADIKPVTNITRFMGKARFQDSIDFTFLNLATSKEAGFVAFMLGQHKSATKKLGELH